jgi:hypothetical protein
MLTDFASHFMKSVSDRADMIYDRLDRRKRRLDHKLVKKILDVDDQMIFQLMEENGEVLREDIKAWLAGDHPYLEEFADWFTGFGKPGTIIISKQWLRDFLLSYHQYCIDREVQSMMG